MLTPAEIQQLAAALAPEIARLLKAADDANLDGAFIASQSIEWRKERSRRVLAEARNAQKAAGK